jgi:hypothetical protein
MRDAADGAAHAPSQSRRVTTFFDFDQQADTGPLISIRNRRSDTSRFYD